MLSALLVVLLASTVDPPLTLERVLEHASPSAGELDVAAELAEARHELAGTSPWRADGATLGATVGARRADGSTRPDLAVELDWPLLSRPAERRALVDILASGEASLLGAARLEARGRVIAAFRDAWAAEARLALELDDLATVQRWAEITTRRAAAGAAADYEVDLLAAEVAGARSRLALAEAEGARARAVLAALAQLPAGAPSLAEPAPPTLPEAGDWEARYRGGLLRRALAAELALEEGRRGLGTAREASRLGLATAVAREGNESVARVGLVYRLTGRSEPAALERAAEARRQALGRRHAEALAGLDARFEHARSVVSRLSSEPPPPDLRRSLAAVEARLAEGKTGAAEALALSRGILALRREALERSLTLLAARQELSLLLTEVNP